jgi:hypothetical protein
MPASERQKAAQARYDRKLRDFDKLIRVSVIIPPLYRKDLLEWAEKARAHDRAERRAARVGPTENARGWAVEPGAGGE